MKQIIIVILVLSGLQAAAQKGLSTSPQHSPYTYVYKIPDHALQQLYRSKKPKDLPADFMTQAVDSFRTADKEKYPLPPGNYLLVNVNHQTLQREIKLVHNIYINVLNNNEDLLFTLHTRDGQQVSDATVQLGKKKITYNNDLHAYYLKKYKGQGGIVQVNYQNVLNFFKVQPDTRIYNPYYRHYNRPESATGYLVFSQPKYKPNDTVKLKAFLVDRKGVPVNKDLRLRLFSNDKKTDTVITVLHPYRPGGFEYQYVMKDSMSLDKQYYFSLEDPKSEIHYINNSFLFEEYELQKIKLNARVNKTSTQRHEPVILTISSTDENGLPLLDARVKITIVPTATPDQYNTIHAFLPDTMYDKTIPIEPVGETIVTLPDSIFPAAKFSYFITCQLLNAENETLTTTFRQEFSDAIKMLDIKEKDDSLYINMLSAGKSITDTATLYQFDGNNNLLVKTAMNLPAVVKIAPHTYKYNVTSDSLDEIHIVTGSSPLSCDSKRNPDSIYFKVDNPYGIPFWYTIYANKKAIERGYTQSLNWRQVSSPKNDYSLQLQYIRGNQTVTNTYRETYQQKKLNVDIKAPDKITPGQESTIQIAVTDQEGKPVPDADVTAYSYTSKFEYSHTIVPYLGRDRQALTFRNNYTGTETDNRAHNMGLNYEYWSSRIQLDTILWYQFTHPAPVFRYDEAVNDSVTQIAPFVFVNGASYNPAVVYIDRMPVYFSEATQQFIYSFHTTPGKHTLKIRTSDMLITIDSFMVHDKVKNFVSIDPLHPGDNITVEKLPSQYSNAEASVLNHYFLTISHNYRERISYVRQNKSLYLLTSLSANDNTAIVGPLTGETASLTVDNIFVQNFDPEEGYNFHISSGLIKQKQIKPLVSEGNYISTRCNLNTLSDQVLTFPALSAYLHVPVRPYLTTNDNNRSQTTKLQIELPVDTTLTQYYTLLFKHGDSSFIKVFHPRVNMIYGLDAGTYKVMCLYNDDRFSVQDSIFVKDGGINFYRLRAPKLLDTKEIPLQDSLLIRSRVDAGTRDFVNESRNIRGIVKDKSGEPLIGATVQWKGTYKGAATNQYGEFQLDGPALGVLRVSYIGFETLEAVVVPNQRYYELVMPESNAGFNEVVVTAYGIHKKMKPLGYAVSTVNSVDIEKGGNKNFATELYGSTQGDAINNIREIANLGFFNPELIKAIPYEQVTNAITGAEEDIAAAEASPFQLRSNFRDAAFWQPTLTTDAQGTASFHTTFPDDITNWRVFALVMNDHQQSGQAATNIRSFKPVSANLALPNFAIEGDSINIIGKSLNYTSDTLSTSRTFTVNDTTRMHSSGQLIHSIIDTLHVTIPVRDSMRFKYTIDNKDGEQRSIPVFQAGTKVDTGLFAALVKDTSLSFKPGHTGDIHIYAEAAVLPVLMKEIQHVQRYKYLCNEQLASKLKAYLLEKKAKVFLKEKFEHNKDILSLLNRLKKTQQQGMWGWWENTTPSLWISLHVVEALHMAQEEGYTTNINTETLADDLLSEYHSKSNIDSIGCLMMLSQLKAKVDFATLTKGVQPRNGYDSLRLLLIKQRESLPINLKPILDRKQTSNFGNAYWGQYSYDLFYSSISQTLLVYKLLRAAGGHEETLQRIRGYFLEERRSGEWRNTYESTEILETILPDLLKDEGQGKASLLVNGRTVTKFPYDTVITSAQSVSFTKKGGMPVYLTATQEYWDPAPDSVGRTFSVSSRLDQPVLETGKKTNLTVTVYAKGDAEYVMVEIPIPAGCSYADKPQSWHYYNGEVHREYEKEMVSIFCSNLSRGYHTFTIELMPRYTGKYVLNPAKATMQYFPLFMGRTGMKKVVIQ